MATTGKADKPDRAFLYRHLPAIIFGAAILTVSSIPYLGPPDLKITFEDKLAHFFEYAIFAMLIYRSFTKLQFGSNPNRLLLVSILFLSTFAIIDEGHQAFIPGRFADHLDLIADLCGSTLVTVLLWFRARKRAS